ncbi:MAG TPA: class I SAM-dependent methyltransferase [Allosphingosinicella sp.]|nr:class I SAM-dependent methyltransferase [Allosphingosinicella sp.]
MSASDSAFAGSIPAIYDRCLGPLLFEPYAEDLADRLAPLGPRQILETAAGTGIVTAALARRMPEAVIVATDLNQAMLDVASARIDSDRVTFQVVDAQMLPFGDSRFDAVVCQFGAMFFPDRVRAFGEALRVLGPGGHLLFNVWNEVHENPASLAIAEAVADLFPDDPPNFIQRTPFGYHDIERVKADLRSAGFLKIDVETVAKRSRSPDPAAAARGMCHGSPLRAEIEARDPALLEAAAEAAERRLARFVGPDGLDAPMSAHVFTASA